MPITVDETWTLQLLLEQVRENRLGYVNNPTEQIRNYADGNNEVVVNSDRMVLVYKNTISFSNGNYSLNAGFTGYEILNALVMQFSYRIPATFTLTDLKTNIDNGTFTLQRTNNVVTSVSDNIGVLAESPQILWVGNKFQNGFGSGSYSATSNSTFIKASTLLVDLFQLYFAPVFSTQYAAVSNGTYGLNGASIYEGNVYFPTGPTGTQAIQRFSANGTPPVTITTFASKTTGVIVDTTNFQNASSAYNSTNFPFHPVSVHFIQSNMYILDRQGVISTIDMTTNTFTMRKKLPIHEGFKCITSDSVSTLYVACQGVGVYAINIIDSYSHTLYNNLDNALSVHKAGSVLYVTETESNKIHSFNISTSNSTTLTYAGIWAQNDTFLAGPQDMVARGAYLYVSCRYTNCIVRIHLVTKQMSFFASLRFSIYSLGTFSPMGVFINPATDSFFVYSNDFGIWRIALPVIPIPLAPIITSGNIVGSSLTVNYTKTDIADCVITTLEYSYDDGVTFNSQAIDNVGQFTITGVPAQTLVFKIKMRFQSSDLMSSSLSNTFQVKRTLSFVPADVTSRRNLLTAGYTFTEMAAAGVSLPELVTQLAPTSTVSQLKGFGASAELLRQSGLYTTAQLTQEAFSLSELPPARLIIDKVTTDNVTNKTKIFFRMEDDGVPTPTHINLFRDGVFIKTVTAAECNLRRI